MKVQMTYKEKLALDYAKRFNKDWERTTVAKDAFLAGVQAILDMDCNWNLEIEANSAVEVEFKEGDHQLK